MVEYQNAQISADIQRQAKIGNAQLIRTNVNDSIIPVIDVTQLGELVVKSATSATIYTTPANKDFYLASAYLTNQDGSSTSTALINATINGASVQILSAGASNSTTNNSITFYKPIKIDRSTNITITAFGDSGQAGIVGYEIEKA